MTIIITILSVIFGIICVAFAHFYYTKVRLVKTLRARGKCTYGGYYTNEQWNRIMNKYISYSNDNENKEIDLNLEPPEESRKKFMDLLDDSKNEIIEGVKLTGVSMTENGLECEYVINKPNPPQDRIINQSKRPLPPKPRKSRY